jgi:hypothetical protein
MANPQPQGKTWKAWVAHAFHVERADDLDPSPHQREIIDRLCREVARRRMATPALMALEMSRPLNGLSAAAMHMLQPILAVVATTDSYVEFAKFLEHRGSIDYLCGRIAHFDRAGRESQRSNAVAGDDQPDDDQRHDQAS